jgi:hypothetical protein
LAGVSGGNASGGDLNIIGGDSPTQNTGVEAAAGGNCPQGGNGGATNVGSVGQAPGGGGVCANFTGSSGAGATGTILITEYY